MGSRATDQRSLRTRPRSYLWLISKKSRQNGRGEFTSWRIIAHSEVGRNVTAGVGKAAAGAVVSRAANFAGALPDDL